MKSLQTWSENVQTLCLSKLQLGSSKSTEYCRRNCRISVFWWAISAIRELHLLLLSSHHTYCLAFCANLSHFNHSKMPEKIFLELFWGPPKWQEKTPKRQHRQVFSWIGALPPMICGVTDWEPFKSEYLLIYGDFFEIIGTPGRPSGPAGQLGAGSCLLNLNLLSWKSCDRCHLVYRQASLARRFATGSIQKNNYVLKSEDAD